MQTTGARQQQMTGLSWCPRALLALPRAELIDQQERNSDGRDKGHQDEPSAHSVGIQVDIDRPSQAQRSDPATPNPATQNIKPTIRELKVTLLHALERVAELEDIVGDNEDE